MSKDDPPVTPSTNPEEPQSIHVEEPWQDWRGTYGGTLTLPTRDQQIPLYISCQAFHQKYEAPDNQGVIDTQIRSASSFLIDLDGGPYRFRSVEVVYVHVPTLIRFYYSKSGGLGAPDDLMFDAIATPRAEDIDKNGNVEITPPQLTGSVISAHRGIVGTFSVHQISQVSLLELFGPQLEFGTMDRVSQPDGKWVGKWDGLWTFSTGDTLPMTLCLRPSPNLQRGPENYELSFSGGKVGSASIGGQEFAFASIIIDYFSQQISLTYKHPDSAVPLVLVAT
jgi:hypothetical protein